MSVERARGLTVQTEALGVHDMDEGLPLAPLSEDDVPTPGDDHSVASEDDDCSSNEGDSEKVCLSFMPYGSVDHGDQELRPIRLLRVPYNTLLSLCAKPRKWLRYAGYIICGVTGGLRFLNKDEGIGDEEMERGVNSGDHFVYHLDGEPEFIDWCVRDYKHSQASVSSRHVPSELFEYYGGCPFTGVILDLCEGCHIIPHVKGSEYLQSVLSARGEPDDEIDIDDPQNMIVLYGGLPRPFEHAKSVAMLWTPNEYLKTNDLPGAENADSNEDRATFQRSGRKQHKQTLFGVQRPPSSQPPSADQEDAVDASYRPKKILLDLAYGDALLRNWGSKRLQTLLDHHAKKFYPEGKIGRGKGRAGNKRRQEEQDQINQQKQGPRDRAIGRDGNNGAANTGNNNTAAGHAADSWDLLLAITYLAKGTSLQRVEAERKRRRDEMERSKSERIEEWRKELYKQAPAEQANAIGIEEDLSGVPSESVVEFPTPPTPKMSFSNNSASDDSMTLSDSGVSENRDVLER